MMLMMVVGFVIVRLHVMKTEDAKILSKLTVMVLTPCLIIRAFEIDLTPERLKGFIACVIFAASSYIVWIPLSRLMKRPFHLTAVDRATMIYPNVGNLILPLVQMTLGEDMVFYAAAMQVPFNLFVWTHGLSLIGGREQINPRKMFLNSNMVALMIGIVVLITGFRPPDVINTAISGLADMVGPLSMVSIGMTIAGESLKKIFAMKKAYPVVAVRLLIFPLIMILLLAASGLTRRSSDLLPVLQVVMMGIAAPPAATVAQLSLVYDNDPFAASVYSVIGNIFCVITIPFMLYLYQMIL